MPQAVYDRLREKARTRGTTTYKDLALLAGIDPSYEFFAVHVGELLDEVNRAEHATGRPLLSAVALGQDRDMPGPGFFENANELGRYSGGDKLSYWVKELNDVYEYWSRH